GRSSAQGERSQQELEVGGHARAEGQLGAEATGDLRGSLRRPKRDHLEGEVPAWQSARHEREAWAARLAGPETGRGSHSPAAAARERRRAPGARGALARRLEEAEQFSRPRPTKRSEARWRDEGREDGPVQGGGGGEPLPRARLRAMRPSSKNLQRASAPTRSGRWRQGWAPSPVGGRCEEGGGRREEGCYGMLWNAMKGTNVQQAPQGGAGTTSAT
ncbi:unnamed protein product, partial [Prorocentrum cordatum]